MKTFVVIPTLLKSNLLDDLIATLHYEKINQIFVLNNTNEPFTYVDYNVQVLDFKGYTIYEMWNRAWEYIRYNYPKEELNIAFLNDDIELVPKSITSLAYYLRKYSDLAAIYPDVNAHEVNLDGNIEYTNTTAGAGGMTGFAFMLKGELDIPYIDENLKLYWGDDDLVKQILLKDYKIACLKGLPIKHAGSTTIKTLNPAERYKIMEQDMIYFNKKYNENRGPAW